MRCYHFFLLVPCFSPFKYLFYIGCGDGFSLFLLFSLFPLILVLYGDGFLLFSTVRQSFLLFSTVKQLFLLFLPCFLLLNSCSYFFFHCFLLLDSCSYFFFPLFLNILKTSHYLIGLLLICFDNYMLLIFNIQSLNNDTTFKNWYLVSYLFLSYLSYCDSY